MKKILIIEDDAFLKNIEGSKFSHEGFEVATAMTTKEVDASLKKGLPDIILLDLMLPDLNSVNLLKDLKKDSTTKKIPVIVFSNVAEDAEMKRALDAGADEYMVKANFTLDEVVEKINTLI